MMFKKLIKRFKQCGNNWFHDWDYGAIIYCDNACAVEEYTCKSCGETKHEYMGEI